MDFSILGPLEARSGGRSVTFRGPKPRTVLGVLLLYPNEVVSTERLIAELWGERPPPSATKLIQTYVSGLRKTLGADAIVTTAPGYVVRVDHGELDALRFQRLLLDARAEAEPDQSVARLCEALALWRGDALADISFEGPAAAEAERLNELRLDAVALRVELELALGRHAQLVGELEALVKEHPLRERLRALLMLALYRSGRQAEALSVYASARRLLSRELGLEPSEELQQLEKQVLVHDPELGARPERTTRVIGRSSLPLQATPFLGRERELAEVCSLLARDEVRLLTLTGPGGIGKTRLAVRAAAERVGAHRDGVFFVALAPIRDPELIEVTVTRALGIAEQPGVMPAEQLRDYLAGRELLLLLDSLEHLADGVRFLGELLAACPASRLLVTSREPLHLAGEHEYPVPPLEEAEAVQLFVERARAVRLDFVPGAEVAEICRRLDGLPLAVELAAARVRALTLGQILARLDRRLPLLTGGPRDAPGRQQTLRAAIDWSYDLLSPDEQRLFARLAVFSGGCTLAAAQAVCEAELDMLQSLVEQNLVRHEGERYLMLQTIREYALERFEANGEAEWLGERHASWFLELAEQAAPELRASQNDRFWLLLLEAERDNLRAALGWLIDSADGESVQRLVCALFSFWHDRGPVTEACEWIGRALALPASPSRRAATLSYGSLLALYSGDYELGAAWAGEGLVLARETADGLSAVFALQALGILAIAGHRREEGVALLEDALALARDSGDDWAIGVTLVTLLSHDAVGDPGRARALGEEAAQLRNVSASTRSMIGKCCGFIAEQSGDFEAAARLYRESIAVAREIGFDKACAPLLDLGWLTLRQGDVVEARGRLSEAVGLAAESGARGMVAGGIAYLAVLAASEGDPLRAALLRGAIETYRETVGEVALTEFNDGSFDQYLEGARALAGEEAWADAFKRGRTISLDEAARLALEPTRPVQVFTG